ncbi:MAG: BatD family protein [candidate division WOR-3 bacterium]|nr:BatD family protein [candidate division WOR-3 bacterium]
MPTVLLLVPALLGAAGLDISAEVDRSTVAVGERLLLTVTATGTDVKGLPQPRLPRMADFKLIGTMWGRFISDPGSDSEASRTVGFVYTIEPRRTGVLTIGPVRLVHEGKVYETQPIAVRVVPVGDSVPPLERWTDANGIELECAVDRSSVYVGEQVQVTYRLFSRTRVGAVLMKDAPAFTGFWVAEPNDTSALKWRPTMRASQPCSVAVVRQASLFPVQPGELTVGCMTLAGVVAVADGLFKGMPAPFTATSAPQMVTVRPLPDSGKPADFGGGVGEFVLTAELSGHRTLNGEPMTLEARVSGIGNIGTIGEPHVRVSDGVKLLAPVVRQQMSREGGRISGTSTFTYSLIPRADGLNIVPAASMSFFDPEGDTYYTLTTERSAFVAAGVEGSAAVYESGSRAGSSGTDILHIKRSCSRIPPAVANPRWSALFYPLGAFVLLAGAVAGRHRRRLEADRGYALRSRARRQVRRCLRESAQRLAAGDEHGYYVALARAVVGYAGDRFNVEVRGLTGPDLRAVLCERGVEPKVADRVFEFSSRCDIARFSPGAADLSPKEALDLARDIISSL